MRGRLTEKIKKKSKEMIGYEINQKELRLIPYIQYVMVNKQKIEIHLISPSERKILSKWRKLGFIEGGASGLSITKDFWDFMCEILFLGYVDI